MAPRRAHLRLALAAALSLFIAAALAGDENFFFEVDAPFGAQDIAFDRAGPYVLVQYVRRSGDRELAGIRRYSLVQGKASSFPIDTAVESEALGHQGLSTEYSDGVTRFWGSAARDGGAALRFRYVPGQPLADVETYRFFGPEFATSNVTMPEVCSDQLHLVARGRHSTRQQVIRVFRLRDLREGAGDYSAQAEAEWPVTPELFENGYPLQGVACSGTRVYLIAGKSTLDSDMRLYVYDLRGRLLDRQDHLRIGYEKAVREGGSYEPEGLAIHGIEERGPHAVALSIVTGRGSKKKLSFWHIVTLDRQ